MVAEEIPTLRRGSGKAKWSRYSEKSRRYLKKLWPKMGYMGAKKMKGALPESLPFFEDADCDEATRKELLRMSVWYVILLIFKPRLAYGIIRHRHFAIYNC
jgi:hypothetical protein